MSIRNETAGTLYIVATPIGNLGDITHRAREVLSAVDLVAAEDTRHSGRLLQHLGIRTPLQAYHEHNEEAQAAALVERLLRGESIALVSDAGTPLVSDPGYRLLSRAHDAGLCIVPVPGACAAVAALSVSGLPTDRFLFAGFPPAKHSARLRFLEALQYETATLVFYISCHRVTETLEDMVEVFGAGRSALFARELTKAYETVVRATLGACLQRVNEDENQRRGEIVLVVAGAVPRDEDRDDLLMRILPALVEELPVKQASAIASRITGIHKNRIYEQALALKREQ